MHSKDCGRLANGNEKDGRGCGVRRKRKSTRKWDLQGAGRGTRRGNQQNWNKLASALHNLFLGHFSSGTPSTDVLFSKREFRQGLTQDVHVLCIADVA